MEQYIVVFVFFALALVLMLSSLKFSKYKEKPGSNCGGDSCACEAAGKEVGECHKEEEISNKYLIDVEQLEKR
jgi:hypothetical protein